jgi:RimJ/RimL family protein N-acetyltransferase
MSKVFLETDRLILRAWSKEDLLPFAKLNANPKVMEHFPKTLTLEETQKMIQVLEERFLKDGFSFFATELKSTGEFIGFIGLNIPGYPLPFAPCVEIGWRLDEEFWNKGYATEGAIACLKWGFESLGLKEIVSFTATTNKTSERIMQKIGMSRDAAGDFAHPNLAPDHPLSQHVLYRIKA